ncbi:AAA family ATPase [Dyadobacter sp. 22481]|uniref:AAA family ATPase n=1 Tax=Dyadobacter sp. 22481 TaxID=3453926 RepID=UPI003F85EEB8
MAKDITIDITTSNLGPHSTLTGKLQTSSLEIGIYANNGSGKTFLSRAFRLLSNTGVEPENSNRLLTIGSNEGYFKLKITNLKESGQTREVELSFKRNTPPVIKNTSGYIFRTFNEEYIRENLDVSKFKPNGQIEGYILGKEKIDLSKEKRALEEAKKESSNLQKSINEKLNESLNDLDQLGIRKTTTEYGLLNFSNLVNKSFNHENVESYGQLLEKFDRLKSIPSELDDIKNIDEIPETNILKLIQDFLGKEFTKSLIADEFKNKVKSKQEFIETGVQLFNKDKSLCPFCEQNIHASALDLIDHYVEYLAETEAQQIKMAGDLFARMRAERKNFGDLYKTSLKIQTDYLQNKSYLPSLSDSNLSDLTDIKEVDNHFIVLQKYLERKKEDVSKILTSPDITDAIEAIKEWIQKSNEAITKNESVIKLFNDKKNNIKTEKLDLNRKLCKAKFIELRSSIIDQIDKWINLNNDIQSLSQDISLKEQNEKISKKVKVSDTLQTLLGRFFGIKYSFDSKTFCLKFGEHILEKNASDVLSTGEKSIVAFCYFIAESHKFIESEDDYQKLFFVIDDPISSQDFHFVYATTQLIRTLNKVFGMQRLRLVLLTHNLEFMSILTRNKIITHKFLLNHSKLQLLGNELLMPYEEHLRDIYEISQAKRAPSHTTPNSIRHVLETINRFMCPDLGLEDFCNKIEGFADNDFLYSLMHDGSHGIIRNQRPVTEAMVKTACDVVTNYISENFGGQLRLIQK